MSDRFTQLETLRKASWDAIASRREFEWRVSIGFWTLLGAFVAGLVTSRNDVGGKEAWLLLFFPAMLGASHVYWICGLFSAYTIDKKEEEALRDAMRKETSYDEPEQVTLLRKPAADRSGGVLRSWYHGPQICTTVAFTLLAMVAIAWKASEEPLNKPLGATTGAITPRADAPKSK